MKLVREVGLEEIDPSARYAYAAALTSRGELDEARVVFEELAGLSDRRVLANAAQRQITRIEGLKLGVVGVDPLWKERNER